MASAASVMEEDDQMESNVAINTQIQLQLYASYIYQSMAFYCNQPKVALGSFALFFIRQSHRWMVCTEMLLSLLTQRSAHITLGKIAKQDRHDWLNGFMAMECAFHLEMALNQNLLDLHKLAIGKGDAHLANFVKHHFLHQEVEILKKMADYLTILRKIGAPEHPIAQYIFDKLTLAESTKKG